MSQEAANKMSEVGDTFNAMKEASQKKRAQNRETSPVFLTKNGVAFNTRNGGAHLIVQGKDGLIDFWPGTGKFITRAGKSGRGVFNLLNLCKVKK